MRRFFVLFLIVCSGFLFAQEEILTADRFFASVGERYASVRNYSASVAIDSAGTRMVGTLIHKAPNLLRMDFSDPEQNEDQVIVFNGNELIVYLPRYRAVLSQSITPTGPGASASAVSASGLQTLRRNYSVAYEIGPDPVPLSEDSTEMVIKLVLLRRSLSEGFREIKLAIQPDTLLIRRMEGRTLNDELVSFEFADIVINQEIPANRFAYDTPPAANMYNNFLFRETD